MNMTDECLSSLDVLSETLWEEYTPLMRACAEGNIPIVRELCESYNARINGKHGWNGTTALILASFANQLDVIRILLEQPSIDVEVANEIGNTAFLVAAEEGHLEVMDLLHEHGANIMKQNAHGQSSLILAVERRHMDVVHWLAGRDRNLALFNITDNLGRNPLLVACANSWFEFIRWLLVLNGERIPVNVNYVSPVTQETALILACLGSSAQTEEIVRLLLAHKAWVNAKSIDNNTALTNAALRGSDSIVKMLLEADADVDAINNLDYTALMLAAESGYAEVVRLLMEKNAKKWITNKDGDNAMKLAIFQGHIRLATDFFMRDGNYDMFKAPVSSVFTQRELEVLAKTYSIPEKATSLEALLALAASHDFHFQLFVELIPLFHSPNGVLNKPLPKFYETLYHCSGKEDVQIVGRLVRLAAAIGVAIDKHPLEKLDLQERYAVIVCMLVECVISDFMDEDRLIHYILNTAAFNSSRNFLYKETLVERAQALQEGPLETSITFHVTALFSSGRITTYVDSLFWGSLKTTNKHARGPLLTLVLRASQKLYNCYLTCKRHSEKRRQENTKKATTSSSENLAITLAQEKTPTLGVSSDSSPRSTQPLLLSGSGDTMQPLRLPAVSPRAASVDVGDAGSLTPSTPVTPNRLALTVETARSSAPPRTVAATAAAATTSAPGTPGRPKIVTHLFRFSKSSQQIRNLRSDLIFARYCPAVMFFGEGFAKIMALTLVSRLVANQSCDHTSCSKVEVALLKILIVGMLLYEFGQLCENRLIPKLQNLKNYVENIWNFFDIFGIIFVLIWMQSASQYWGKNSALLGKATLSVSAIFYSFSVMRYFIMSESLGKLIIMVFAMTAELSSFAIVFLIACFGFFVALFGLFKNTTSFESPGSTFLTLFSAMLADYEDTFMDPLFDPGLPYQWLGIFIFVVFLTLAAVVLISLVIARMSAQHNKVDNESFQEWQFTKAETIREFILNEEKNPFCMLPPPLNLATVAVAPIHHFYTFQAAIRYKHLMKLVEDQAIEESKNDNTGLSKNRSLYGSWQSLLGEDSDDLAEKAEKTRVILSVAGTVGDIVMGIVMAFIAPAFEFCFFIWRLSNKRPFPRRDLFEALAIIIFYPAIYVFYTISLIFDTLSSRTYISVHDEGEDGIRSEIEFEKMPRYQLPPPVDVNQSPKNYIVFRIYRAAKPLTKCNDGSNPLVKIRFGKMQALSGPSIYGGSSPQWGKEEMTFPIRMWDLQSDDLFDLEVVDKDPMTGSEVVVGVCRDNERKKIKQWIADGRYEGALELEDDRGALQVVIKAKFSALLLPGRKISSNPSDQNLVQPNKAMAELSLSPEFRSVDDDSVGDLSSRSGSGAETLSCLNVPLNTRPRKSNRRPTYFCKKRPMEYAQEEFSANFISMFKTDRDRIFHPSLKDRGILLSELTKSQTGRAPRSNSPVDNYGEGFFRIDGELRDEDIFAYAKKLSSSTLESNSPPLPKSRSGSRDHDAHNDSFPEIRLELPKHLLEQPLEIGTRNEPSPLATRRESFAEASPRILEDEPKEEDEPFASAKVNFRPFVAKFVPSSPSQPVDSPPAVTYEPLRDEARWRSLSDLTDDSDSEGEAKKAPEDKEIRSPVEASAVVPVPEPKRLPASSQDMLESPRNRQSLPPTSLALRQTSSPPSSRNRRENDGVEAKGITSPLVSASSIQDALHSPSAGSTSSLTPSLTPSSGGGGFLRRNRTAKFGRESAPVPRRHPDFSLERSLATTNQLTSQRTPVKSTSQSS